MQDNSERNKSYREKLYTIIFEAETPAGKLFDVVLIWAILISVVIVCLESIKSFKLVYGEILFIIEWCFTILFTVEYFLRIISIKNPLNYIFSLYGIVDFLAILPNYLAPFFTGLNSLVVIRSIRLLRIFRLFKLTRYMGEAQVLQKALASSRHKITVFLFVVFTIALFMGSVMYVVEGEANGFTSIPKGMYWAIVTMTTVGYGDLAPVSDLGQTLASILMVMGYGIIAIPTGIMSVEIANATKGTSNQTTRTCPNCLHEGHVMEARFCRMCGSKL